MGGGGGAKTAKLPGKTAKKEGSDSRELQPHILPLIVRASSGAAVYFGRICNNFQDDGSALRRDKHELYG
jgi:hypothetical protein